jgi:hypothetical protein
VRHQPAIQIDRVDVSIVTRQPAAATTMKPTRPTSPVPEAARAPRRSVALIVETSVVYGRQILHGIARYVKTQAGWSIILDEEYQNQIIGRHIYGA